MLDLVCDVIKRFWIAMHFESICYAIDSTGTRFDTQQWYDQISNKIARLSRSDYNACIHQCQ